MEIEGLIKAVIQCAYDVRTQLSAGFLESVYQKAMLIELKEKGIRADLLHISRKALQHRNCAKSSHNSADSKGVGDGLLKAIFLRNLKICDCAGLITAYLDGIYNKCCIPQGVFSVFHAEISFDDGSFLVYVLVNGGKDNP